ncbi:c-type cytochrome, partial [Akkermansiaceae bacterium]|nr:c-type cytochrome [Akkermansiaceae bacterium]
TREKLATGFGAHLAYAGHDMHGLTVGPDGRIYWTVGDKGVGATSKEGLHFNYPNHGALLRCDPDGSNFEVYARGLRNIQEIAFDQFGNIFGVDNDSDRPGEKERFVYIVRHMDAGWRANWQYRNGVYNPWMDENLSVPYRQGQPAYITPPISLYKDGPAGMAFNPGTALNEEWQNYFFHTSAPNGQQWGFQVEQNGASFKMANDMQISSGVPIVGINFGPDGALYGVDWGGGYPLNQKGAVWKWDVAKKHPLREETTKKLREDYSTVSAKMLVKDLGHADQRVRLKAQFELVKRKLRDELESTAKKGSQLARIHAIWGIGQLNRKAKSPDFNSLLALLNDSDVEVQTQVVKTVGDHYGTQLALHEAPAPSGTSPLTKSLLPLLNASSERLKFHVAIALGNIGDTAAASAIHEFNQGIPASDTYLRHAAIVATTGCAPHSYFGSMHKHESEVVQKIAVVASRRRGSPEVARYLNSHSEYIAAEAARAIHDDWTIPTAMPALAASLETTPWIKNESLIRRSINANFHLGTPECAKRVAAFAARTEVPEALRLEALDALAKWTEPEKLDRVNGRYRPLDKRDPAIAKAAIATQLKPLLTDESQRIQSQSMSLARSLSVQISGEALIAVVQNSDSLPVLRIEALRGLGAQSHPDLETHLIAALDIPQTEIRIAALDLLSQKNKDAALKFTKVLLKNKNAPLAEKQAALSLLTGALASAEGDALLNSRLASFASIPAGLQLDFAEAAEERKLKAPSPDLAHTMYGGNAKRGADLFNNHLAAQCVRCHKVKNGKGSDIGPNLKSIGRNKDRAYLLEALAEPQKVIAEGYGAISLTLKNGNTVAGTYRSEKNGIIEIRDAENKATKIKTADVKERSEVISTMPPMGLILTKREVRDIIEYLASLQAK